MLKPGERTQMTSRSYETRGISQMEGIKGLKGVKELNYKLIFIANNIRVDNNQFDELLEEDEEDDEH